MRNAPLFSSRVCLGLGTTLLCAVWQCVAAPALGLMAWAGFAGCTCYFACPDKGLKGLKSCFPCVFSGVAYAYLSLWISAFVPVSAVNVCAALVITHLMCVQSAIPAFSYIPGTFFGSFSTFAAGGSIKIIPCLALGLLLGIGCDKLGQVLFKNLGKEK